MKQSRSTAIRAKGLRENRQAPNNFRPIFRSAFRDVSFWDISQLAWALAAIALILSLSPSAQSQSICEEIFQPQARIEIQNENISRNFFNVSRGLKDYSLHFGFRNTLSIEQEIRLLRPGSTWIDMGAGQALALIEGLRLNRGIKGVGIAYRNPGKQPWFSQGIRNRFQYISGDYVENLSRDGKLNSFVGQTDLITDLYGPLSYSEHFPDLLQIYFDLLKPGGELLFNLMKSRSTGQNSITVNQVLNSGSGNVHAIVMWLKTIPGIEVSEVIDDSRQEAHLAESSIAIRIKKRRAVVTVPKTLETVTYISGSPPVRIFKFNRVGRYHGMQFDDGDPHVGTLAPLNSFHFVETPLSFPGAIDHPSPKSVPVDLPSDIYSADWNTDNLIPFATNTLPPEITRAQGLLYYGKSAKNDIEVMENLKIIFQFGRASTSDEPVNLTAHIRGIPKSGLFSTSPDFDVAANFGYGHNFMNPGEKGNNVGAVFVIDGAQVPAINIAKFNEYLQSHKPPGTDMGSSYKIETEVALTGFDPRQIKGAWIRREITLHQPKATLEFVPNPNYDPSWKYPVR
jgi:hypothetical protein